MVSRFIKGEISWIEIGEKLEALMQRHEAQPITSVEAVLAIDAQARIEANIF